MPRPSIIMRCALQTVPRAKRLFSTRQMLRQEQHQPQYQAPTPATEGVKPNPHRQIYKQGGVGRAVAYNFLVAMVTFQALYWSWLKLESMEVKQEKQDELETLEGKVRTLTGFKGKDGTK